jgi:hypothetical protein
LALGQVEYFLVASPGNGATFHSGHKNNPRLVGLVKTGKLLQLPNLFFARFLLEVSRKFLENFL